MGAVGRKGLRYSRSKFSQLTLAKTPLSFTTKITRAKEKAGKKNQTN